VTRAEAMAEIEATLSPAGVAATVDRWEAYDLTREEGTPSVIETATRIFQLDPVANLLGKLLKLYSGAELAQELLRRQCLSLKAEIEGPDPTVIERLLAERTMICWLDAQICHLAAVGLEGTMAGKAHDRAHRRYLSCLKSLALVRNKALPALRLSLAVDGGGRAMAVAEQSGGSPGLGPDGRLDGTLPPPGAAT
jgi:hypothetical protein